MDLPRDNHGKFFTRRCVDPKCDGELVRDDREGYWRCNGLSHRGDCDPLEECRYWHRDGDVQEAPKLPGDRPL
jgi:hypothetical protein